MQLIDMDGSRLVDSQFSLKKCTAMTAEKSGVCPDRGPESVVRQEFD